MKKTIHRNLLYTALLGFALPASLSAQEKPNILFIALDDLNCDVGAYGNPVVHSPNLDSLAAGGVMFANNHAQRAVCGPSRASLLSGFTPEHTGITGFRMYLRDMYPDVVTLPQFFKNQGYTTVGMGKIHDPRNVSVDDEVDLVSWTEFVEVQKNRYALASGKPAVESADVADDDYTDGRLASEGVTRIQQLAAEGEPFFLAVGFKKPHLPFAAPTRYWDLYDRDSISLAPFRRFAENDQEFVHNPGNEFKNGYDDVPQEGDFPYELQREYIHGYYACVSYVDAQVGKLIDALKASGAYDNTIIVLWGDHGFSLGDHTNWGKHTNFEKATRCPLIIKAPGMQTGKVSQAPSELLDIYPTLVELAGYAVPDTLDGSSLVPVLSGAEEQAKAFAVSQFRRGGKQGFSLRSHYYQYVEWSANNQVEHRQLFNFAADPYQTENLHLLPGYQEIIDTFSFRLNRYLENGENGEGFVLTGDTDSLGWYRNLKRVSFSVYGRDQDEVFPLKEVSVVIDPYQLPTSNAGFAALDLQPASYSYRLEKDAYYTKEGSLALTGDTLIRDTLERGFYTLTVQLTDRYTGDPLSGVQVLLGDDSANTNLQGSVTWQTEKGSYSLIVEAERYQIYQEDITISSDSVVSIDLSPSEAAVKFSLQEGTTPVNEAEVSLEDHVMVSNALGLAEFGSMPVDSTYAYTIAKPGYEIVSDSLFLRSDTTVEVEMIPALYDVIFLLKAAASQDILPGTSVTLGDSVKVTGDDGKVEFFDYAAGTYTYVCENQEYVMEEGVLEVEADTALVVELTSTGIVSAENEVLFCPVPNPASETLRLRNVAGWRHLKLMDLSGKTMMQRDYVAPHTCLKIEALEPGIYFLKVSLSIDKTVVEKIVINR